MPGENVQEVVIMLDRGRVQDALSLWESLGCPDPKTVARHPFVEGNLSTIQRVLAKLDPESNLKKYLDFRARIISEEQHGYIQTIPLSAPLISYESRFDNPYYGEYEEGEHSWCPGVITHFGHPNEVIYFGHLPGESSHEPRQWSMVDDLELFQPMCQFDLREERAAWDGQDHSIFIIFFFKGSDLDTRRLREARVIKPDNQALWAQSKKLLEET